MGARDASAPPPLRERLTALKAIPLLPATVETLLGHADVPAREHQTVLAACARRDPALLAHLLRGRDTVPPIAVVTNAQTCGAVLRALAEAFNQRGACVASGSVNEAISQVLWPRAVKCACTAEALASLPGMPRGLPEQAYLIALLLDLGGWAFGVLEPEAFVAIISNATANDRPALLAAERAHFGMTHSLAGRILADSWRLPTEVRRHLWLQHQPHPAPATQNSEPALAIVLHYARRCAWHPARATREAAMAALDIEEGLLNETLEAAADRSHALQQAAPASAMNPQDLPERLAAFLAEPPTPAARTDEFEALAWAEQVLMAREESAEQLGPLPAQPPTAERTAAGEAARLAQALEAPLRTLVMRTNAWLAAPGVPDPGMVREIHESSYHAERILRDFTAFTAPPPLSPKPVLLNHLIRRIFRDIADRLRWQGIRLELDLAEGIPRIAVDPDALIHALSNIAINSERAMHTLGGVLTVTTRPGQDGHALITLADSGFGLDAAIASTAFEPFVATPGFSPGPGLGLTVAREHIERQGGSITLATGESTGTVCQVALPVELRAPSPHEASTDSASAQRPTENKEPTREPLLRVVDSPHAQEDDPDASPSVQPTDTEPNRARVLVADPDYELGELLQELLARRGFEVTYLRDGSQALQEARREPFGQLLIDANLTATDGTPLAEALHADAPSARLILTRTPGPDATATMPAAVACLDKPFPIRALLAALEPVGLPAAE